VTGQVEILIDADGGAFLDNGEVWRGLRVSYRSVGARRWARFIVVAAPGQSLLDLLGAAIAVVARADATGIGATRARNEQLRLDSAGAAA
jgi:hypothetical protein